MGAGSLLSHRHRPKLHNTADKNVHCWQWMEQTGRDWLLIIAMDVGGRWRKDKIIDDRRPRVLLKPAPRAHFQDFFQVVLYSCHTRLSMLIKPARCCCLCVAYFVIATGCRKLNCCFCNGVGHTGTFVAEPYLLEPRVRSLLKFRLVFTITALSWSCDVCPDQRSVCSPSTWCTQSWLVLSFSFLWPGELVHACIKCCKTLGRKWLLRLCDL